MLTFKEALQEAKEKKSKTFLVKFTANNVDDKTFDAWVEAAKEFDDVEVLEVSRHDQNTAKVVIGKGSAEKLKRKWMVERVYKYD